MIREVVLDQSQAPAARAALRKRLISGLGVGGFGLLVVSLGGWWFTAALGGMVHLGLLEFFRMAQFKEFAPPQNHLGGLPTAAVHHPVGDQGGLPADVAHAVLPLSGAAICGWLLLQPVTGSIADIAASIFGLFYLGFLPSHWLSLRGLDNGLEITLSACLMIVATDIGSWAVGRRYGRRPSHRSPPGKPSKGRSVDSCRPCWSAWSAAS